MAKPIRCRVVQVDEKTHCQKVGNSFIVDEQIKGKLCGRAQKLVEAAAIHMDPATETADHVDVPCPDHHVMYRLSFESRDTPDAEYNEAMKLGGEKMKEQ